jgi:hypothetical protein
MAYRILAEILERDQQGRSCKSYKAPLTSTITTTTALLTACPPKLVEGDVRRIVVEMDLVAG